jgi:hypothetical protein
VSKYKVEPADFAKLKTIGIAERGGKVKTADFAKPHTDFKSWLNNLPQMLAAESLRAVVAAMQSARANGKAILFGLGGHVIKCGLAPVLIDLMRRGYVTAFAMNGSAAIHDFEIAIVGHTSEDVEAVLPDGRFGAAEETGRMMNDAVTPGIGLGEAYGQSLSWTKHPSILREAYAAGVPVTVHVAIGTDTPHTHPAADPARIGAATHHDFRLFCTLVTQLNDGGVYLNIGSAVVLPEVFLKALSAMRNLGHPVANFTTVNMDFVQHYRPRVNVVERPHAQSGGRGYALTGHHEIMVPLLAALLIETGA